jgi:hypothetical protein
MSDLLHIFLRITLNETEQRVNPQLPIDQIEKHTLFALQLLNRWCIRAVIFSKFPKRPISKSIAVNV